MTIAARDDLLVKVRGRPSESAGVLEARGVRHRIGKGTRVTVGSTSVDRSAMVIRREVSSDIGVSLRRGQLILRSRRRSRSRRRGATCRPIRGGEKERTLNSWNLSIGLRCGKKERLVWFRVLGPLEGMGAGGAPRGRATPP